MATKKTDKADTATTKRGPAQVTESHKAAMAQGREEGRVVRDYLQALREMKPKRGRKRTPESVQARLVHVDDALKTADVITELSLIQERADLMAELDGLRNMATLDEYEAPFVEVAAAYSARKGIHYNTWREVGVPSLVLRRAGIGRG